jgi:HEPN domain-containing protein
MVSQSSRRFGCCPKACQRPGGVPGRSDCHCQQAAEKAIKGFLTFHGQRFEKVHNLPLLVAQAMTLEPTFSAWLDAAERLTPYATLFRYPGDILEPDPSEFTQALTDAEQFYAFILEITPQVARPQ